MHTGFCRLHWIMLVMHWRCRTSKIVNAVNFNIEWEGDIMAYQFKLRVTNQVDHAVLATRIKIVNT